MEENHPNLNYQPFPNNETMVIAAVREEIDAFAVDYPVGLYLLDRHAVPGDFNVLNLLYSQHLQAGFAHESELIRDQVNEVLRSLDPEDLRQITQKWISTEQISVLPIWFYPALALLALAILLSYLIFLHYQKSRLSRTVEEQTRELLLESQRLSNIIEGSWFGTWEWNVQTGEAQFNHIWAEQIGHRIEDISPMNFDSWVALIHPDDLESSKREIERNLKGETPLYDVEFRMRHREGHWVWIQSRGRLVTRSPDGKPLLMYGTHMDISERKSMELQVQRAQRMEGVGTLAGGMAHDINNVLAPILVSIELLREHLPDDERAQILETIEMSAIRGADIVRQVLSYARGAEGEFSPVDPQKLILEISRILKELLPRNIEFTTRLPTHIPLILGDSTQLHQILLNLCLNARDAMPDGGKLLIRMSSTAESGNHAGEVKIEVIDTGVGIPPHVQKKIFDPFFTTKKHGHGTGLGLSTTLSLVEGHGGRIEVTSQSGKGTTFTLHFPVLVNSSSESAITKRENPSPDSRIRRGLILVIDDEESIRRISRFTLEKHGFQVITAKNGQEGLDHFLEHKGEIKAVVTDLMMPVMDGTEAIQRIHGIDPHVPIIAMSGLVEDERFTHEISEKFSRFLAKPFTAKKLIEALDRVLNTSKDKSGCR